jgi:uncharacterized membrane protein HdeD (DUF308 family)
MNVEEHLEQGERLLARTWKTVALCGLLAIAFGVVALVWPDIGLTTLIALFAAFALATGLTVLYSAFTAALPRDQRAWLAFDGILAIAVGVVVLVWPDLSARALLFAIAAWAVASGVLELVLGAFVLPVTAGRSLLLMLWGLVSVAFGVVMFAEPGEGALVLLALIAAFAIVTGVMEIAYAYELRRVADELKHRPEPRATTKPVTHG